LFDLLNGWWVAALATYEPRVKAKVDKLIERMDTGQTVDMTEYGNFFAFDVMGDVGECHTLLRLKFHSL
jgi:hypothetical protein